MYMIIVSLTTIPSRLSNIKDTIDSIFDQSIKPNNIVLNLPLKYNNYSNDFKIEEFSNKSIIINRCIDYGPATKLLGLYTSTLFKKLKNEDLIIIIDDDRNYDKKLIERLMYSYQNNNCVITNIGASINGLTEGILNSKPLKKGYCDILFGCDGYLLTKKMCPFNKEIFELNHNDEKYYVDDVWISGFLNFNNYNIYNIDTHYAKRNKNSKISQLWDSRRLEKNITCIKYFKKKYKIWESITLEREEPDRFHLKYSILKVLKKIGFSKINLNQISLNLFNFYFIIISIFFICLFFIIFFLIF